MARLVDGTIDEAARADLLRHAGECPGCGEELEWVSTAGADLEALGDAVLGAVQDVDVVDAVMAELSPRKGVPAVRFEKRPALGRPFRLGWLGLAAAAGLMVFVWLVAGRLREDLGMPEVADSSGPVGADRLPARDNRDGSNAPGSEKEEEALVERFQTALAPREEVPGERGGDGEAEGLTERDILSAYRESIESGSALSRLVGWAELSREEAKALAASDTVSLSALIGAAQSLPLGEAIPVLMRAMDDGPDDPYVRYRLAWAYGDDPLSREEALEQIAALQGLDPDNAMVHYLTAQYYLEEEPPDVGAAMAALARAKSLASADAYSREAALHRRQALVESGMDFEVAQLLSALTVGRWEYDELLELAGNLMATGEAHQASGDTVAAVSVYEAVLDMGRQLETGAEFSQQQLAGLDIERAAIDALNPLYVLLGSPEQLEQLAMATNLLIESILQLSQYLNELSNLLVTEFDTTVLLDIANAILEFGDLYFTEFVSGFLN